MNLSQYLHHDSFCECWLIPYGQTSAGDDEKSAHILSMIEPKLPLVLEIDYDRVLLWRPNIVSHWFVKCGVSKKSADILKAFSVNGVFLFDLDMDLLNEMDIPKNDCIQILRYMRALRSKLQYNVDEEDEEMTAVSVQIQQFDAQIRQMQKEQESVKMKLDDLVRGNNDEYNKYKEWALKRQCIELKNKKVSKKDIALQLEKPQSWVNKVFKMKVNQIKKPSGNIIKQIEMLQAQIIRNSQTMEDKQTQMIAARQRLHKFLAD